MARRTGITQDERFAALAARLADPAATWRQVLTLLACWPPDHDPALALTVVEAVVDRWPVHQRDLPRLVARQLIAGDVRPCLRLVRVLDLRPLWQVSDRAALLQRMIIEGGLRELREFTTRYDRGDAQIALLVEHVLGLRTLYVAGSGVGPRGAELLASCPALAGLLRLSLPNNNLGDAGAQALLDSPHLVGLRTLNLYANGLSSPMVERVLAAPQWQRASIIIHNQRDP